MERTPSQDVPAYRLGQGRQQRRSRSNPIGQGQAVEFDAFSGVDLSLAVKRQVVAVLGHQHIGKKSRAWRSAPHRPGDHRRLRDRLANSADDLGADMPDDLEQGDALQHLGLVLAKPAQLSAASLATTAESAIGKALWPADASSCGRRSAKSRRTLPGVGSCRHDRALQDYPRRHAVIGIFKPQLQLVDGRIECLRRRTALHPAQLYQLRFQHLYHEQTDGASWQRRDQQHLERRGVIRRVCEGLALIS